jgi:hypothetical protein
VKTGEIGNDAEEEDRVEKVEKMWLAGQWSDN